MDIILATRELGKEIQKDSRFIAYAKTKLALESNEELNKKIGEFNICRMNLERLIEKEEREEAEVTAANQELRSIYTAIMENDVMKEYNAAKAEVDKLMNEVMGIINMCFEGQDPETCTLPEGGCSGSCATCAGCN